MTEKFQNKYRSASHRRPKWDYSADALYFLTIVTQHRKCILGKIETMNGRAYPKLSTFGKIVEHEWLKSFEIRRELLLHEFVIMPNHLHAIVEINNKNRDEATSGTHGCAYPQGQTNETMPTDNDIPSIKRNPPIRLPKSISSFIAGFKSAVNTKIDDYIDEHQLDIPKYNRNNHFFLPNYHDHIVRNQREYIRIKNYIINNPKNWKKDSFSQRKAERINGQ